MVELKVMELLIAPCAAVRFNPPSVKVACTAMEPASSTITILVGSIVLPVVADTSAAIACCSAETKEACNAGFARSAT
jgi:hypothetical protein